MVKWLAAGDLAALTHAQPADEPLALVADLRDPLILPLLRPAPTSSDYDDERRPGASDRGWFLARRAATRSLVALFTGCDADDVVIGYDGPGAPRVKSGSCHVSVSGRGPLAAIAIARDPIGIDLEIQHSDVEVIADVLHPEEMTALSALSGEPARRRFLEIWTAKEAFLKALGTGLNIDPATVVSRFEEDSSAALFLARDGVSAQASFHSAIFDGHAVIASCVRLPPHD